MDRDEATSRSRQYAAAGAVAVLALALAAGAAGAAALSGHDTRPDVARDPAAGAASATAVDLPTSDWRPGQGGDAALLSGELSIDPAGCVFLAEGDGTATYAVWPAGYTADLGPDGELTVRGPDGKEVARGGDQIRGGGGYHPPTPTDSGCLPDSGEVFTIQSSLTVTESAADEQEITDHVTVTCTRRGVTLSDTLSDTTIAARPAGVVLDVASSMPPGSFFTYASDGGPAGGETMTAEPTTWTFALPPGQVTLTCMSPGADGEESDPATLVVTDPGGYWRGTTPATPGCPRGASQPSWIDGLAGTGATPEDAVHEVLANFTRLVPGVYAAKPAEIGYVGDATQTWIATKNGRPSMTIGVTRRGSSYAAGPGVACG